MSRQFRCEYCGSNKHEAAEPSDVCLQHLWNQMMKFVCATHYFGHHGHGVIVSKKMQKILAEAESYIIEVHEHDDLLNGNVSDGGAKPA